MTTTGCGQPFTLLIVGREIALQLIFGGTRLDQGDRSVLISKNQMSVDQQQRSRTLAWTAKFSTPNDVTCQQIDAGWKSFVLLMNGVNMAVQQNPSTMVIVELVPFQKILFFCNHRITLLLQFQQARAGLVTG